MRQRVDVVQLKETGQNGYEFSVGDADYRLRFEDGAWRLVEPDGDSELFESFNEAMNYALDGREGANQTRSPPDDIRLRSPGLIGDDHGVAG